MCCFELENYCGLKSEEPHAANKGRHKWVSTFYGPAVYSKTGLFLGFKLAQFLEDKNMGRKHLLAALMLFGSFLLVCSCENKGSNTVLRNPYPEEIRAKINRGLVSFPQDHERNFLSWRLLPSDPIPHEYYIWRKDTEKADAEAELIMTTSQTCFVDSGLEKGHTYAYGIQVHDKSRPESFQVQMTGTEKKDGFNALTFNIGIDYKLARVVAGDLTGDGEFEVLIAYSKMKGIDPYKHAWMKSTDSIKIAAFRRNGERLWTFDLGTGIETGPAYAPIVIWDIDADGRDEVILKTNKSNDPLNYREERLTVLNGETGKIIREAEWPLVKGHYADDYDNNSRNYIAVAHSDGKNPSIIVGRGLYKTQVIWAYDSNLNKVWERVLGKDIYNPIENKWLIKFKLGAIWSRLFKDTYKGSHSLPIADVNEDGAEEILWGEHCIGPGGKDLWKVEDHQPYTGHPDIVFAADIIPAIKGKEIYYCREGWKGKEDNIGMLLVNSQGKTIWAHWGYTHIDGGWVSRVVPGADDPQCFGYDLSDKKWTPGHAEYVGASQYLWSAEGKLISNPPASWVSGRSFPVDWEGDGIREICTKDGTMMRYNGEMLMKLGTRFLWGADLYGDYREEIVYAPNDGKVYILFNTEMMESPPKVTRIADRQYRNDLSRTAMQFEVIPTESGFIFK
jgi:rhamnogalacturonan endolyase